MLSFTVDESTANLALLNNSSLHCPFVHLLLSFLRYATHTFLRLLTYYIEPEMLLFEKNG
jgi:hypothetical protein